jgi:hypothetical protein
MILIDLAHAASRRGRVLLRHRRGLPDTRRPFVRLMKSIGARRVPATMLHLLGYVATPIRVAPLCSPLKEGGKGYGRLEYWEPGRLPVRLCPDCAGIVVDQVIG